MSNSLDFIFTILESLGDFLLTPPISVFLAIIFGCFAIKIIRIVVN